ncbi:MAG: NAD(P)-dependent oxidoreductase, partial [Rhodospirillaceae bacterium]|nr:NAD(P)-dependent oxidoreductase [Rhodospirillaceae bacterium]
QDNVIASANLALAARRNRTTHFIYCSTISVYSGDGPYSEHSETDPTIAYGVSKLTTEQALRNLAHQHFAVTILRFAGLHGYPRQGGVLFNFVESALNNAPIDVAEPDSVYTLTFMNDAVGALKQAAITGPRDIFGIYNVANPVSLSLSDLAERVIGVCNSKSKIVAGDTGKRNRVLLVDKFQSGYDVVSSSIEDEIMDLAVKLNDDRK